MRRSLMTVIPGLLKPRVSGVTPIVWLLRDEFLTDEAAPLASPRTAEPGPGTWTIVDDDECWAISSSALQSLKANETAQQPAIYSETGLARVAGRALLARLKIDAAAGGGTAGWINVGFTSSMPISASLHNSLIGVMFRVTASAGTVANNSAGSAVFAPLGVSVDTYYRVSVVLRDTGAFLFVDDKLIWVSVEDTTATLYPVVALRNGTNLANPTVDYLRVRDLPAPFNSDYGIASVNEASPASGTSYTATADAITDMAITLPESPSSGDRMELRYRVQDDDNYMVFYARYSGSAWDVRIDKVEGGSATQLLNVTNVGTPDTLRVITDGNLHDAYTKSGTTWTKRNGQINNSFNAALTTIKPVFEVGSVGSLRSYPRTSPAYAELDRT